MLRRLIISIVSAVLSLVVLGIGAFVYLDTTIRNETAPFMYASVGEAPSVPTTMILGAQVFPDLVPSKALAYRLQTGIELYASDKTSSLLMSGDGRSKYYNEVATMQEFAKAQGVPESALILDTHGLRTYASCYRARHEYNLTKVMIVTQADHLRRAVYTCRSLGIEAVGVMAPEFSQDNSQVGYLKYKWREKAALVLAWVDVKIIKPES